MSISLRPSPLSICVLKYLVFSTKKKKKKSLHHFYCLSIFSIKYNNIKKKFIRKIIEIFS